MVLSRFFRRESKSVAAVAPPPENTARVPDGSVVYAVGDIHGRLDLLERLRAQIVEDAAQRKAQRKVIVYLGDYVDRGPKNKQVIELLMSEPLAGFESIHLMGNHEHAMLQFREGEPGSEAWLAWGGEATLFSYGIRPRNADGTGRPFEAMQEELRQKMPAEHVTFLSNLPHTHEEGDYFFVHAGVRPNLPLNQQSTQEMMFIRDEFVQHSGDYPKTIVFGHTIFDTPFFGRSRIGIDTGAYATGRLTALVLEGNTQDCLSTA